MAGALKDRLRKALDGKGAGYSRAGLSVMAIRVAGAGLGLIAQVLASRLIGAEAFGYYALALVWLLLLGHGATAGTNQLICRFLSAYRTSGDLSAAAGLLRFSVIFAGLVAAVITAIAIALVQSGLFGLDAGLVILMSLAFAAIPLLVLQDVLEAVSRGLDKPNLGIGPAILLRHVAIIVGVAALMMAGQGGDATTILAMTIGGLVASIIVQTLLLARHLRKVLNGAKPQYRTAYWLKTALPIAFLDAADVLFNNADILILGLFVPAELVAAYYAATRLVQILGYVPYGITAATAQKYAALAERKQFAQLQTLIGSVTVFSTTLVIIGAVALWVLAAPLLALFGDEFTIATSIVPLLCLGTVLVCALGPGEDVLTMLGQEKVCSAVFALAVTANVALNLALIPILGLTGAALATVLALGLRGALLSIFAYRRLGLALPLGTARLKSAHAEEAMP